MKSSYTSDELLTAMKAECAKTTLVAFAMHLGTSPGFVSEVFAGKKPLSQNLAESFARTFLKASSFELERRFLIAS